MIFHTSLPYSKRILPFVLVVSSMTLFIGPRLRAETFTDVTINGELNVLGVEGVTFGGTLGSGSAFVGPAMGLLWYPKKAAFRVGRASADQWNDAFIGEYSVAGGYNSKASGWAAVAFGNGAIATGNYGVSIGTATMASSSYGSATAFGYGTTASNFASLSTGYGTLASGTYSSSFGYMTQATAGTAAAFGNYTIASGYNAIAAGQFTIAQGLDSFVVGRYNLPSGHAYTSLPTNPLFIVGNGDTEGTRKNAFVIYKDGTITMQKAQGDILMGEFGN